MHRPDNALRRGFTLMEVLVGIAILAMAAVVLGAAYVNTLGAHEAVARRAAAGTGMDYLRDIILNEPERTKVEHGGNLALPDNRQMNWEAVVEEATVPDLFRVLVRGRITGTAAKDGEAFEQALMLLRPSWSDAGKREQLRGDWAKQREAEARR
jgi:general secretion pathway protein I